MNKSINADFKKIVQQLEADSENFAVVIPLNQLVEWMRSKDLEKLGALHAALGQVAFQKHITPPLEFLAYFQFCSMYLLRCLRENPQGEWSSNRYEAGWELCRWFVEVWNDKDVARGLLVDLKKALSDLYKSADVELRTALETAVLEHLFEDNSIATFFDDWKQDEILAGAYRAAKLWVDRGGISPLNRNSKGPGTN